MCNSIDMIPLNDLIDKKFVISSYQRGYRWNTEQVEDLLNDIFDFTLVANKEDFYCLQPVVVYKNEDDKYEVIDGQQRLTTVQIILRYLNQSAYEISYTNRKGSKEFLEKIANAEISEAANKNVDYFYMKNAYNVIEKWFKNKELSTKDHTLRYKFYIDLLERCRIIWYEVSDKNELENIFTRLNIGKINLTDAELVKALFLKSVSDNSEKDITDIRQQEIASQWDEIEHNLRDPSVWSFINPSDISMATRIEYIFKSLIGDEQEYSDEHGVFRYFLNRLKIDSAIDVWEEIKDYYRTIIEWYSDRMYYHLIGYLTTTKTKTIKELINEYYTSAYTKKEFINRIDELIKKSLKNIDIDDLNYEANKNAIKKVLLLFNVLSSMDSTGVRFPFNVYESPWSLEHIHAQNAEGILNNSAIWGSWIDEHIKSFKTFTNSDVDYPGIVKMLENFDRKNMRQSEFEALFNNISEQIESDYGSDLDSMSNMALLQCDKNSCLSNSFFDVKRRKIIEMDQRGDYIPICTRNVFLKYYSSDPSQIHYWSEQDRKDYLDKIKLRLSKYLSNGD